MQREITVNDGNVPHSLSLDGRARLKLSGVREVQSFDENSVVLTTTAGGLIIYGLNLHIDRLSLETGDVGIEGRIDRMLYTEERESTGFWSRLFR
ncbi:MAG: sporulation protein YabP [Ruminococcaceae bacterium]|nr:sporulation protein YabP [Oscillospiraceae bacterium]